MRRNKTLSYFSAFVRNLPHLTERERTVLLGRLRQKTLVMIGTKFLISEGRIRQIEKSALKKLRSKKVQQSLFKLQKTKNS